MVSVEVVAYRAIDDVAITAQDTPAIIDVLANDLGFNYQRDLMIFTNPQFGKVIITNDQYSGRKVTYTPDPGYLGTDFFEYAVDDGTRNDIASVSVSVIVDHDGDHIDDRVDDCLDAANANQRDSNGDGFGNWCDADLNNDGRTNFADMALFRAAFGTSNPDADFDGNGSVNFADLARFKALFGKPPGPSATAR
jgi:hypothetical protein